MKRFSVMVAALCVALFSVLAGCQRDVIVYPTGNYYIDVDLKKLPELPKESSLWQVIFYDANTKMKAFETYITPMLHPSDMPTGAYIRGLQPGLYDAVVFNRNATVTAFNMGDASDRLYAYSPNAGYSESTPIVFAPDDVYVWSGRVNVPYVSGENVHLIAVQPEPILDTREFVITGIEGLDIAEKIFLYLSRQDRGSWLCPVHQLNEKVILVAEGQTRSVNPEVLTKAETDSLVIWTPINSFGIVDGDEEGQPILLTVAIEGPNGSIYYAQADVTEQILSGEKVIFVTVDIEVEPLEQGGFDPNATPWDVFVTTIELT